MLVAVIVLSVALLAATALAGIFYGVAYTMNVLRPERMARHSADVAVQTMRQMGAVVEQQARIAAQRAEPLRSANMSPWGREMKVELMDYCYPRNGQQ